MELRPDEAGDPLGDVGSMAPGRIGLEAEKAATLVERPSGEFTNAVRLCVNIRIESRRVPIPIPISAIVVPYIARAAHRRKVNVTDSARLHNRTEGSL
jgi:hypothetical protein